MFLRMFVFCFNLYLGGAPPAHVEFIEVRVRGASPRIYPW